MEQLEFHTKIKSIEIEGLFNKKNFVLPLDGTAKILISENGCGKTTILNIIVAFFNKDFKLLKTYPFKRIIISLTTGKKIDFTNHSKNLSSEFSTLINLFKKYFHRFSPQMRSEIITFFEDSKNDENLFFELIKHSKFSTIYFRFIEEQSNSLDFRDSLSSNSKFKNILKNLDMLDFEVEYLPTYRRIEKNLSPKTLVTLSSEDTYNNEVINFGMIDVQKIISTILENIRKSTLEGFSNLNKDILIDFFNDNLSTKNTTVNSLSLKSNISLIVEQIKEANFKKLENDFIDKIIDKINTSNNDFFNYYLTKLNDIYLKQIADTNKIKKFIEICNKYLVNKQFEFDQSKLKVQIYDLDKIQITLSDLSSGEKQITSLFAKLFLLDKNNLFFIIDEPELSLSITWQRMLLSDIYNSGKVKYILATTHSPFIFDNEFDTFAYDLDYFFKETTHVNSK